MLGVVDPWRKTFDDKPIYTILVPLDTAYEECKLWSQQEFSKTEFSNYLKINDIYLFKNVDDFKELKDEIKEEKKNRRKRNLSPERREQLSNQMKSIRQNKQKEEIAPSL